MSRLIQGVLKFPDGSPISGATIRFIASKFIYTGVPVGVSHDFNTDTFGYYSESILEGSYHVFFKQSGHDVFTHLTDAILAPLVDGNGVPLGDPSTLEDIIGENLPEEPVYAGCGDVPSPSSFTVTGAFTTIILGWEGTAYTCHDVTEIWVNTVDDLATASFLDTTQASVYSHALGNDAAVYYWIRFRNKNDVTGNWFSTAGKFAQTAQDPGRVLADLQEDIYESQLFKDLRTSINTTFYQVTEPKSKPDGKEGLVSGDTWINTSTNQRYIWDTSQQPPKWVAVTDKEVHDAVTRLANTEEVADGQIKGFFQATEPLDVESFFGDIWIDIGQASPLTAAAIYRYEADDGSSTGTLSWRTAPANALGLSFIKAYNADAAITDILTGATDLGTAVIGNTNLVSYITGQVDAGVDNMVRVFSGDNRTEQTGMEEGDLYNETSTVAGVTTTTTYRYSGNSWVEVQGASNVEQLSDLTDGKRTIYTTPGVPKDTDAQGNLTIKINDLWIPTANICTDDTTGVVVACGTNGSSIAYRAEEIYRCTTETIYAADGTTISAHPVFVAATRYHDLIESLDENLQAQIDNKIQTYAQGTLPYANDVDTPLNVTLDNKVGDLWLCTADITIDNTEYSNGSYYEYSRTANGANYDYSWTLKADITSGLSELVNNKRTIYGGSTIPAGTPQPLLANDLWIPTTNVTDSGTTYKQGEMYTWTGSTWDLASRYSADILALSDRTIFVFYLPGGVYTESTDSFETPPTLDTDAGIPAPEVNDLWVITDRDDEVRRYNGSVWELLHVATLANVDTKITEATSYCRNTSGNITYHTTESACTTAGHTWVEGGAIAALQNTVSTTIGDSTTTIQELADSTDGLEAQYTVKIDNNGHVSGFGLASTPVDGTPFSSFIVNANQFSVSNPNNSADVQIPFVVDTNTNTVGVDGALIVDGSITSDSIAANTIGATEIAADSITAVEINATDLEVYSANILGQLTVDQISTIGLTADYVAVGIQIESPIINSSGTDPAFELLGDELVSDPVYDITHKGSITTGYAGIDYAKVGVLECGTFINSLSLWPTDADLGLFTNFIGTRSTVATGSSGSSYGSYQSILTTSDVVTFTTYDDVSYPDDYYRAKGNTIDIQISLDVTYTGWQQAYDNASWATYMGFYILQGDEVASYNGPVGAISGSINYFGTRGNITAYSIGTYREFGSVICKVTTAGTTAASSPSFDNLDINDTVQDGSVIWTVVWKYVYFRIYKHSPTPTMPSGVTLVSLDRQDIVDGGGSGSCAEAYWRITVTYDDYVFEAPGRIQLFTIASNQGYSNRGPNWANNSVTLNVTNVNGP